LVLPPKFLSQLPSDLRLDVRHKFGLSFLFAYDIMLLRRENKWNIVLQFIDILLFENYCQRKGNWKWIRMQLITSIKADMEIQSLMSNTLLIFISISLSSSSTMRHLISPMGHFLMRLILLTSAIQHTRLWGNHTHDALES
jgi:hypothetical protein